MSFDLSIEISRNYDFSKQSLTEIGQNIWVRNQWPLVYFIQNEQERIAYVGESTNAYERIKNHLANPERSRLNKISIIGSDKFNKSATLDIESSLIQYLTSEGSYTLQNGNYGLINHHYYQQDRYKNLFREIWSQLKEKKIVTKSLSDIEKSEVFKYSPYKSLTQDQYKAVLQILDALVSNQASRIFVRGVAGTGKTILATYLVKLLHSDLNNRYEEHNEDELREVSFIKEFQLKYPKAKIGLVISMTPLREALKDVFRKIPGLKPSMVINPSDTFKVKEKYDLLIVDEAHRLRRFKNLSWMGAFRKNNQKLSMDDTGTELDWILANSKNQLFFYDPAQSVKPSDVSEADFTGVINNTGIISLQLKSQMRVRGGEDYITFVDDLMNVRLAGKGKYVPDNYELYVFDSMVDLYKELEKREEEFSLCRLVAGYAWPWLSDPKRKPKPSDDVIDIELDGLKFKWNSTDKDWIRSANAFKEIGCIHTTQGQDLKYTGVIFGKEINYNTATRQIEIDRNNYFDINGKKGIVDPEDLKGFIINIYKTILYRGELGAFLYACNKDFNDYLKKHIPLYQKEMPFRRMRFEDVKPYVNAIPLIDISAAAGSLNNLQIHEELEWIEPPFNISAKPGYFVCKVIGESMNEVIPNGSYCLFSRDEGGTREGKIVLVESREISDTDSGAGYTVKEYRSTKKITEDGWEHESIILKPLSDDDIYKPIELSAASIATLSVVGIFQKVLVDNSG